MTLQSHQAPLARGPALALAVGVALTLSAAACNESAVPTAAGAATPEPILSATVRAGARVVVLDASDRLAASIASDANRARLHEALVSLDAGVNAGDAAQVRRALAASRHEVERLRLTGGADAADLDALSLSLDAVDSSITAAPADGAPLSPTR